jgi:type II secretory pathway predicted ATPase ExeA
MNRSPWVAHFGFTATPFTKSIAARDLFARAAHDEAVARIGFVIAESGLGILTGEVGVGKTVALRAAVAGLDPLRHHLIYLSNPPALGTRGLHVSIVAALGAQPRFFRAEVAAQAAELLAAEEAERHRRVILAIDLCRHRDYADMHRRILCRAPCLVGLGPQPRLRLSA